MSVHEELRLADQKFIEKTEREVLGFLESLCPEGVDLDTMKQVLAKRWLGAAKDAFAQRLGIVPADLIATTASTAYLRDPFAKDVVCYCGTINSGARCTRCSAWLFDANLNLAPGCRRVSR